MLFYPVPFGADFFSIPTLCGIEGEDVYFSGDMGQRLNGWFWRNPDAKHLILFSHGNSGNITIRTNLAELMLRAGYSVFVYDYQGFGRSTGVPSVEAICSDVRAAYDFIVDRRFAEEGAIVSYGESLGASVASYLSTVRGVSGLILQSGFASLKRIAVETMPLLRLYPDMLFPKPNLDSCAVLSREHPPALIIHGELDQVIPLKHSLDLHELAVGSKRLLRLPLTAHADIFATAAEDFGRELKAFRDELLILE